jgi:phenylpropionate dioxygenase-like ring-hydroxylating dioxygenase large terminal subunit
LPALASSELATEGGDPVHVELLGENFVAFRDRQGNIGLLDEHCCHRGASLTVGRVENCTAAGASRENRWHQDRARMREGHFSGAPTLFLEDVLV